MKHLSLLTTLLLTSSMVYAGWITKGTDYKGDCLEMMCDCVEDDNGNGYCCPEGTSFTNTGNPHPTYTPCKCPENLSWDSVSSKCVECLTDHQKGEGACPTPQKPLCINNVCQTCPKETPVWDTKTIQCVDKCFSKSDCPSGHYCSNGECLACPQRVEIPTYQGCKSTSDNRLCVIGTRIGSTSYKKNKQWVNPYQCTYNVYFSGTLDTKAKSKAHNKVYINGGHALGYDSRKYTYSDSYIGQLAPGGGVEVEIYNNSGRPCSSLSAWMTLAE